MTMTWTLSPCVGFIFPHKVTYFLEESLSEELIKSYRDDLDFQNLIDLVQKEFQCCGISSEGFRYVGFGYCRFAFKALREDSLRVIAKKST